MICEFPSLWPVVEFEQPPELMTISEIEEFAPAIPCELDDDATLEIALKIPGGLAAFAHAQRKRDEAAGLTAVSSHSHRRKQNDDL